jgi:hypothetical protein
MPKIPREQVAPYGPYHIERTDPIDAPRYVIDAHDQNRGHVVPLILARCI